MWELHEIKTLISKTKRNQSMSNFSHKKRFDIEHGLCEHQSAAGLSDTWSVLQSGYNVDLAKLRKFINIPVVEDLKLDLRIESRKSF